MKIISICQSVRQKLETHLIIFQALVTEFYIIIETLLSRFFLRISYPEEPPTGVETNYKHKQWNICLVLKWIVYWYEKGHVDTS